MDGAAKASPLFAKYGERVDAESAREKLAARIEKASEPEEPEKASKPRAKRKREPRAPAPAEGWTRSASFLTSREGKAVQRKVLRGVFGMLKKRL